MQTAEFSEEMDELFFWLDETENILHTSVRVGNEEFLEQLLEKVKVRILFLIGDVNIVFRFHTIMATLSSAVINIS